MSEMSEWSDVRVAGDPECDCDGTWMVRVETICRRCGECSQLVMVLSDEECLPCLYCAISEEVKEAQMNTKS